MNRIDKARGRVVLEDINPISHDEKGRITNAFVSGSHATIYEVIIRRNNGTIETECLKCIGENGRLNCNGGLRAVCYHALAVLLQSAQGQELQAAICENQNDAEILNNIHHGELYKVASRFAHDNPVWFVTYPKKPKKKNATGYAVV